MSVYPDSDKVSVFHGIEADGLDAVQLVRAGSGEYRLGEGAGPVRSSPVTRDPCPSAGLTTGASSPRWLL